MVDGYERGLSEDEGAKIVENWINYIQEEFEKQFNYDDIKNIGRDEVWYFVEAVKKGMKEKQYLVDDAVKSMGLSMGM